MIVRLTISHRNILNAALISFFMEQYPRLIGYQMDYVPVLRDHALMRYGKDISALTGDAATDVMRLMLSNSPVIPSCECQSMQTFRAFFNMRCERPDGTVGTRLRSPIHVYARSISCYAMRELFPYMSLPTIAQQLGLSRHSTVITAKDRFAQRGNPYDLEFIAGLFGKPLIATDPSSVHIPKSDTLESTVRIQLHRK